MSQNCPICGVTMTDYRVYDAHYPQCSNIKRLETLVENLLERMDAPILASDFVLETLKAPIDTERK